MVTATDFAIFLSKFGSTDRWSGIKPVEVAVVINLDDPESEAIGQYYQFRRHIPESNVVRVRLTNAVSVDSEIFISQRTLTNALPVRIKALALAFTHPIKVGAYNSITSAFSYGVYVRPSDVLSSYEGYTNPYPSRSMRLSMMLPGPFARAKRLIDLGIASDRTYPTEPFFCMHTTDSYRNIRCRNWNATPPLVLVEGNLPPGPAMGYFQGLAVITAYPRFPPGAWADNLTSYGAIEGSGQTTVWQILDAGATGSHGTVEEPYALPGKFPDPSVVRAAYVNGDTLVEAAWKSIRNPYQGLLVGEPLANPWMRALP